MEENRPDYFKVLNMLGSLAEYLVMKTNNKNLNQGKNNQRTEKLFHCLVLLHNHILIHWSQTILWSLINIYCCVNKINIYILIKPFYSLYIFFYFF